MNYLQYISKGGINSIIFQTSPPREINRASCEVRDSYSPTSVVFIAGGAGREDHLNELQILQSFPRRRTYYFVISSRNSQPTHKLHFKNDRPGLKCDRFYNLLQMIISEKQNYHRNLKFKSIRTKLFWS